jgi:hypothetical protein
MMTKTWGKSPSDLNELRSLHAAFETTTVGSLLGLLELKENILGMG